MAINIEWQILPGQNGDEGGNPQLYPRITDNGNVDFQALCEKVAEYGSHTRGTVKSVMSDIADVVAGFLREGKTVDLVEFGAFRLSVGTDVRVTSGTPHRNRLVKIRGVSFQPHKALMDSIGIPDFRRLPDSALPLAISSVRLQDILSEYFKTHDWITRSRFEKLCNLKRTTAYSRLKELEESGFLRRVGYNRATRYEIIRR